LPAWRNGRRKGLKIPFRENGVRVRVPPPAPFSKANSFQASVFWRLLVLIITGARVKSGQAISLKNA
jgi:hypothetical protein